MHRTALILLACLCAASAAGAVLAQEAGVVNALVPLPLLQQPGTAEPASNAGSEASEAVPTADSSPVQEIVAGVLTGSLAAVLTLKLLYGRRRRDDSGQPSA